jgi:hypothetical protein
MTISSIVISSSMVSEMVLSLLVVLCGGAILIALVVFGLVESRERSLEPREPLTDEPEAPSLKRL